MRGSLDCFHILRVHCLPTPRNPSCHLTAAPLGRRTVQVIWPRLLQPTGRFRRRSLSLVVRLTMRALLTFIVLCVFLCGCVHVSTQREVGLPCRCRPSIKVADLAPERPTSQAELQALMMAANRFAGKSDDLPDAIRKLKPIAVYYHQGHVVIALHRADQEERGYYIVPGTSSSSVPDAGAGKHLDLWTSSAVYPGWKWKPIDKSMQIYDYILKR
jgi:hypothetical protein